jgi:hypothetical protein
MFSVGLPIQAAPTKNRHEPEIPTRFRVGESRPRPGALNGELSPGQPRPASAPGHRYCGRGGGGGGGQCPMFTVGRRGGPGGTVTSTITVPVSDGRTQSLARRLGVRHGVNLRRLRVGDRDGGGRLL